MASLVFTHIEAINKREGGIAWRVITGAGIYNLAPNSPVARNIEASQFAGKIVIAVSATGSTSRIVGISTRDGTSAFGRINYP